MSDRYKGAILSPTAPTVTPQSAGGIYTSSQQLQYQGQGVWPTAFNNPINNSLRFRASASAYLNRTPASAGNRRTWTWSAWVKRSGLGSAQALLAVNATTDYTYFTFNASDILRLFLDVDALGYAVEVPTVVWRDPSAWYHIILAMDTTQATAGNRVKIYVNGVQQTVSAISGYSFPAQNWDTDVNSTLPHAIGNFNYLNSSYFDGYMTEVYLIDGTQLTPSSFGTTDAYGIWQPIPYTGAYGTNGFYLPFTDNSALTTSSNVGLGKDFSGNGNYWVTNNISITAGSTYDSMKDVPTNTNSNTANYATLNPLNPPTGAVGLTFSNGNLNLATVNSGAPPTESSALSTIYFPPTGKFYAEMTVGTTLGTTSNSWPRFGVAGYGMGIGGYVNFGGSSYGTFTTGDVMMVAWDASNGKIWWGKNGTWLNSGVPASGTGNISTFTYDATSAYVQLTLFYSTTGSTASVNFGQQPFAYTPPSGFYPLNTYNLPTPTILDGDQYMDATLYTGNSTTNNIVNASSMQPDLVWIKSRSNNQGNNLFDSIRGAGYVLFSNATNAETNNTANFTSFNSNGFSLASNGGDTNFSGYTYVAWQWRASNAAGVSNTQGTITSTVSANTTSGFSIATFTIQSSGNATVGHGLGIAPSMIIIKSRSAVFQWNVYHASLGNNSYLVLNTTAAEVPGSTTLWNSTSPTSTVFSLGTAWPTYLASATAVAYCFSQVAGYSAFGSYTGNGSADGPFVFTGFRPRFVMYKNASYAGTSWAMLDSSRNTYNVLNARLFADGSDAENTATTPMDFTSNGFKVRSTNDGVNRNGDTIIYMAFAENPFKIARAR